MNVKLIISNAVFRQCEASPDKRYNYIDTTMSLFYLEMNLLMLIFPIEFDHSSIELEKLEFNSIEFRIQDNQAIVYYFSSKLDRTRFEAMSASTHSYLMPFDKF